MLVLRVGEKQEFLDNLKMIKTLYAFNKPIYLLFSSKQGAFMCEQNWGAILNAYPS